MRYVYVWGGYWLLPVQLNDMLSSHVTSKGTLIFNFACSDRVIFLGQQGSFLSFWMQCSVYYGMPTNPRIP